MPISRGKVTRNRPGQALVEAMKAGSDIAGQAIKLRQQWEQLRLYEQEIQGLERKRQFEANWTTASALAKQNPLGWTGVAKQNPDVLKNLFSVYGGTNTFQIEEAINNIANSDVNSDMYLDYVYQQFMLKGLPMDDAIEKANEESKRFFEISDKEIEGGVPEKEKKTVYEYHSPKEKPTPPSGSTQVPFGWEEDADVGPSPVPGEKGYPTPPETQEGDKSWTEAFAGEVKEEEVETEKEEESPIEIRGFSATEEEINERIRYHSGGNPEWGGGDWASQAASAMILDQYPKDSKIWENNSEQHVFKKDSEGKFVSPEAVKIYGEYKAKFELQQGSREPKTVEVPEKTFVTNPYSEGAVPERARKLYKGWLTRTEKAGTPQARMKAATEANKTLWKYDMRRIPGGLEGSMRRAMGMESDQYSTEDVVATFTQAQNSGILDALLRKKNLAVAERQLLVAQAQLQAVAGRPATDVEDITTKGGFEGLIQYGLQYYANDPYKLSQYLKNMISAQQMVEEASNPFNENNPQYQTYKDALTFLSDNGFWQAKLPYRESEDKLTLRDPENWLKKNGYWEAFNVIASHIGSAIPQFKQAWEQASWKDRMLWFYESPPTSAVAVQEYLNTTQTTPQEESAAERKANEIIGAQ